MSTRSKSKVSNSPAISTSTSSGRVTRSKTKKPTSHTNDDLEGTVIPSLPSSAVLSSTVPLRTSNESNSSTSSSGSTTPNNTQSGSGAVGSFPDLLPLYDVQPSTLSNTENIHDEFLQLVRDSGMESIAKEAGVLNQNGEIPVLREYNPPTTISPADKSSPPPVMAATKSRARKKPGTDNEDDNKKKKKPKTLSIGDKGNKGLRHFSMKVCQKVESKKATNYNEVAEELVKEFQNESGAVDSKNIRRRVYDALNVLMAMNIIAKDKKDIRWLGLPTNAKQELDVMEADKSERLERIKRKKSNLDELVSQQNLYKLLVERNEKPEYNSVESRISLPFIIVNTKSSTVIECEVADDRTAYFFNFSLPFEIHDDSEILKRLNF